MKKRIENAESHCKSYPRCYGCNAYREPTNADRIRAMTDEELAYWSANMYWQSPWCDDEKVDCNETKCIDCIEKWLKQPAEGDA